MRNAVPSQVVAIQEAEDTEGKALKEIQPVGVTLYLLKSFTVKGEGLEPLESSPDKAEEHKADGRWVRMVMQLQ